MMDHHHLFLNLYFCPKSSAIWILNHLAALALLGAYRKGSLGYRFFVVLFCFTSSSLLSSRKDLQVDSNSRLHEKPLCRAQRNSFCVYCLSGGHMTMGGSGKPQVRFGAISFSILFTEDTLIFAGHSQILG